MGSKGRSGSFEVKVGQTRVKRSGSLRVRVIEVKTFGGQKLGSFEVTRGHLPERSLVRLIVSQQEFVKLTSEPAEWLWHSFEISRIWKIWLWLVRVTSNSALRDSKKNSVAAIFVLKPQSYNLSLGTFRRWHFGVGVSKVTSGHAGASSIPVQSKLFGKYFFI